MKRARIIPTIAAPTLAVALSIAMAIKLGITGGSVPEGYMRDVAAAVDNVSYATGGWTGSDTPITPSAVDLLKPNRLLQRRYSNLDGAGWFDLLIVHCGDVRDMIGHFPPICYPANGWTKGEQSDEDRAIANTTATTRNYVFSRDEDLRDIGIMVTSVFVVPTDDGLLISPDRNVIERAGRFGETARRGAAQIQIVTPRDMDEADRHNVIERAFHLVEPLLETIGEAAG
jgi:hypothetical protein